MKIDTEHITYCLFDPLSSTKIAEVTVLELWSLNHSLIPAVEALLEWVDYFKLYLSEVNTEEPGNPWNAMEEHRGMLAEYFVRPSSINHAGSSFSAFVKIYRKMRLV